MGRELRRLIVAAPDLALAAALDRPGVTEPGTTFASDAEAALAGADVLVDFSTAAAVPPLLAAAARRGVPVVSGTTGLGEEGETALHAAAGAIPVVWAPNMSLGVNVLLAVTEAVARALPPAYAAEILELHHRHKRDAPSGTALGLLGAIRAARPGSTPCFGRHGLGDERPEAEVGVHALRGGEVVGEHRVFFLGDEERIELAHVTQSRAALAAGALTAARWVVGRPAGRYTLREVLGLDPREAP
jgi:4-hydroxy-tetrahydrodipicolinate reductase